VSKPQQNSKHGSHQDGRIRVIIICEGYLHQLFLPAQEADSQ
jgi:hypothetical protein